MGSQKSVVKVKGNFKEECCAYVRGRVEIQNPKSGLTGGSSFQPFKNPRKKRINRKTLVYRVKKKLLQEYDIPQVFESEFYPIIIKTDNGYFVATVHKHSLTHNFRAKRHT